MNDLNLIAPLNQLGYGQVGRAVLRELSRRGVRVAWWHPAGPYSPAQLHSQGDILEEDREVVERCWEQSRSFSPFAPSVRIWHPHDMALFPGRGKRWGWPIFELDQFTPLERHHLGQLDGLLVCSRWARGVVREHFAGIPCGVVPLGVDRQVFAFSPPLPGPTIFLTVGKWEVRKGHDVLCRVFDEAFGPQDEVRLILICSNPFLRPTQQKQWEDYYRYSPLGEKIEIVSERFPTQRELARKMTEADCGIFLSRAEGWNLEALEMLALGRSVIATDCTAHTEFLTSENALLIPMGEKEPAQDGMWFSGQGSWYEFGPEQMDRAVEYVRQVHQRKQSGEQLVNTGGLQTAEAFSWSSTVDRLMEVVGC